jgi:cytidylate kinase
MVPGKWTTENKYMKEPIDLPGINNITVSGRIGSGATTLATKLAEHLHWKLLDGGKLFRKINQELGMSITQSNNRPDHFDLAYEEKVKKMLHEEKHNIIQSHLAGFDAQGIEGIFKILILCEDHEGNDKPEIRIDRLVNRDNVSVDAAKKEVKERELQHLTKFRRLYVADDPNWVYWNKKYYDLVINTYMHNQEETFQVALDAIKERTS